MLCDTHISCIQAPDSTTMNYSPVISISNYQQQDCLAKETAK